VVLQALAGRKRNMGLDIRPFGQRHICGPNERCLGTGRHMSGDDKNLEERAKGTDRVIILLVSFLKRHRHAMLMSIFHRTDSHAFNSSSK
jgi:hypothetical protein